MDRVEFPPQDDQELRRASTERAASGTPTAAAAERWLRRPTAERVDRWLRGRGVLAPPRAHATALTARECRVLARAPRLVSGLPAGLPAPERWAHFSCLPAGARSRQLGDRAPQNVMIAVPAGSDRVLRLGYRLVVIDGEVVLLPRLVEAAMLRTRVLGARERYDPARAVTPLEPVRHPDIDARRRARLAACSSRTRRRRRAARAGDDRAPARARAYDDRACQTLIYEAVWGTLQELQAALDRLQARGDD